jgi:hypothetical protein
MNKNSQSDCDPLEYLKYGLCPNISKNTKFEGKDMQMDRMVHKDCMKYHTTLFDKKVVFDSNGYPINVVFQRIFIKTKRGLFALYHIVPDCETIYTLVITNTMWITHVLKNFYIFETLDLYTWKQTYTNFYFEFLRHCVCDLCFVADNFYILTPVKKECKTESTKNLDDFTFDESFDPCFCIRKVCMFRFNTYNQDTQFALTCDCGRCQPKSMRSLCEDAILSSGIEYDDLPTQLITDIDGKRTEWLLCRELVL